MRDAGGVPRSTEDAFVLDQVRGQLALEHDPVRVRTRSNLELSETVFVGEYVDPLRLEEPMRGRLCLLQEDVRSLTDSVEPGVVFVTHSVDEAVFLAGRIIVLTDRPGRIALDVPITLPRNGIPAEELRGSPEYAAFRGESAAAVRAAVS